MRLTQQERTGFVAHIFFAVSFGLALLLVGCVAKGPTAAVPSAPGTLAHEDSFIDLRPGGKLRIVVPVFRSGGYRLAGEAEPAESTPGVGNTLTLRAADLLGYDTSHYALEGGNDGKVKLRLMATERNRDGKVVANQPGAVLPFPLPANRAYVRLIYLTRSSQADHNMAIASATKFAALESFTDRVRENPGLCREDAPVFCTWVPVGIAVRPE